MNVTRSEVGIEALPIARGCEPLPGRTGHSGPLSQSEGASAFLEGNPSCQGPCLTWSRSALRSPRRPGALASVSEGQEARSASDPVWGEESETPAPRVF